VTLGRQLRRPDVPTAGARWCETALPEGSVYRFLARERTRLFPAELFADLFQPTGRRSVPPSILAVVMVLQRLEGLSDREAADRFAFDVRWRYAAGVADAVAGEETASFAHTVLVDLRARLRRSTDPDRIFRVTCQLARQLGLVGVKRVLDSAPLEDAVATQDTVMMLRGAIRGLLRACPPPLAAKVRGLLQRDDGYAAPGKPGCDWTDRAAREQLVDALVRDAYRAHYALRGERLNPRVVEPAALLATVTGQDIEETADGRFQIFEDTAPDRVISTVDPEARHGHKTAAHGFDGYKGHVAADPDSEIITAAEVSRPPAATLRSHPPCLATWSELRVSRPLAGWSMATAPMAPAPTWPGWTPRGSPRWSRPRCRPLPAAGSPKTSSASTSRPRRSPARPGSPWRSARPAAVAAGPGSAGRVASAHCGMPARPASGGGWSPSTPRRPPWPPPASASATLPGWPTTGRPGPRSSASSPTCCAAATAAAAPACAGWSA
jgi:Transposase domain (DUF772)